MDKKSIAVVAVCMVLLMFWGRLVNKIWPPIEVEIETGTSTNVVASAGSTNASAVAGAAVGAPSGEITGPVVDAVISAPTASQVPVEENTLALENDLFKLTLTSEGGGLKLVELKNYARHVTRKAKGDDSLATLNEGARLPVLAIADDRNSYVWTRTGSEGATATATWANGLVVTKELTLSSNYLMNARVRISNPSTNAVKLPPLEWSIGASTPLGSALDVQFTGVLWYDGDKARTTSEAWFQNKMLGCIERQPHSLFEAGQSNVVWAGVQNQFFTLLAVPDQPALKVLSRRFDLPAPSAADLEVNPKQDPNPKGHQTMLAYGEETIAPGGALERTFEIYAGPKEYTTLARIAQQRENQLDLVMNFSGFWGYFAKPLLTSMNGLQNLLHLGYGWTIVVITVLIKLIFWPLTKASTQSMKRMAKLQPQMKELQEKYKDDPQKQQRKLMEFMKENKVNPMGSCLPLLLQMPVFIGFYRMLQSAIELRGASFLWVSDLSSPDTLFFIPFLAIPLNLMPLLMGATMFYQARLTPPSPGMDASQQAIMRYMPLMFMFILYGMSSGLTLYWTVNNLLSIVQTKLTRADEAKNEAAGAAAKPVIGQQGSGKKKKH